MPAERWRGGLFGGSAAALRTSPCTSPCTSPRHPRSSAARARTKVRDTFKFPGNTLILNYIHRATPRTRPPCVFGRYRRYWRRRWHRRFVQIAAPRSAEVRRSFPPTRRAFGARLSVDGVTRGRQAALTSSDCVEAAVGARCEQRCERQRRPGRRKGLRGSAGRFARPASGLPALRSATGTMGKLSAVRFARVPPRGTSRSAL